MKEEIYQFPGYRSTNKDESTIVNLGLTSEREMVIGNKCVDIYNDMVEKAEEYINASDLIVRCCTEVAENALEQICCTFIASRLVSKLRQNTEPKRDFLSSILKVINENKDLPRFNRN